MRCIDCPVRDPRLVVGSTRCSSGFLTRRLGPPIGAAFVSRNGVELRTSDHFHLQHDKTIIVDGTTVETGSFNYAASAETMNSENVLILRDMPEVVRQYTAHWQSRWALGVPYVVQ